MHLYRSVFLHIRNEIANFRNLWYNSFEVINVANKKMKILNIVFFVIIVLTFVYYTYEFFHYRNELEAARKMHGDGYYIVELLMMMVPISFVLEAGIETSIYYNLRYFISDENKTTIKMVFNILMLMSSFSLFASLFILEDAVIPAFSLLLVLRIIYAFIKKK